MSPHQIRFNNQTWKTAEALFQALRFNDETVIDEIRASHSPMTAKMIAKRNKLKMVVQPVSDQDLINMQLVLKLKIEQHCDLRRMLLTTKDSIIIEDCSKRRASPWGAQLINGKWVGDNLLGKLWMDLRESTQAAITCQ